MKAAFLKNLAIACVIGALAACSSTVPLNNKPIENQSGKAPGDINADSRAVPTVKPETSDPLNDPQGVLAKRSVYFDYDSYDVKPDFRALVQAHARYLTEHKNANIVIQGNTDERGGSEYNLALGQRRADAVKSLMLALGVNANQIETVSFGKEKPKATGHNEAAWAENRRADIVYK
ncbi:MULTISPECIES: peptidoglycan-associated lipoprotein Pal [Limnobacter]|uniref:Peptidoglycan-associated lipoprotein n=1 Tax=Limnobacter litoralis TaxID=481366 RepID=A0ABQ5YXD4_9BURK|nr:MULTISPECIES: peptidoglycan-associated lipoprotein Pal [Limnobacter]GLR27152.1 peptidoglycan-associated lipoprotein [Limnobacter litoralis]HEX5485007.1 peptidoglycan-associated lipoprotein Pal [Limnobacter sp.]